MNVLKAKVIVILACLAAMVILTKAKAEQHWPPLAVARNARAMASTGREANCIDVASIEGALPYCLALIKHEPERCEVIKDPQVKEWCIVQSTPPK